VQTYSFVGRTDPIALRVLQALRERYGVAGPESIQSPVGVAQAYDLTHLLARAIDLAGSTDRAAIRDALEHLGPYQGLVRNYERPFSPERHDALFPEDAFMARYGEDGQLIPAGNAVR
jgi:branched-chain amino acid transport system substrate-binding protein